MHRKTPRHADDLLFAVVLVVLAVCAGLGASTLTDGRAERVAAVTSQTVRTIVLPTVEVVVRREVVTEARRAAPAADRS